jgi:N-acetylmuramoyl-L-alanine amidase
MLRLVLLVVGVVAAWPATGRAAPVDEPPLKGAVIVVDPGHGGQGYSRSYTGGTRGVTSRQTESELNLKVALELAKQLKDRGATVYLTREADHRLSPEGSSNKDELHARIDFFEQHNCHFFLSVHHNAGAATATGHTALYKHNADSDTLYEALARDVNDALEGAVPGPKRALIKGSYHILRETPIPGTIAESGFMTNKDFDELSSRPDYPKKEAAAIAKGAAKYWVAHKDSLLTLREKLTKERAAKPRDPKTYTAIALNPDYKARMDKLLAQVAPGGKYDPAKVGDYVGAFKKAVATDPKATFTVKAAFDGERIKLTGGVSDRKHHDRLIDLLVAMKLYAITNEIVVPKSGDQERMDPSEVSRPITVSEPEKYERVFKFE